MEREICLEGEHSLQFKASELRANRGSWDKSCALELVVMVPGVYLRWDEAAISRRQTAHFSGSVV